MNQNAPLTEMEKALFQNFDERLSSLEDSLRDFMNSCRLDSNWPVSGPSASESGMKALEEKLTNLRESLSTLMQLLDASQKTNAYAANELSALRRDHDRLSSQVAKLIEVSKR